MERLYLGRETRVVWEGLFILKNSTDHRVKSEMWAKKRLGYRRRGGEETKTSTTMEARSEKTMESLKGKAEETLFSPSLWGLQSVMWAFYKPMLG